MPLKNIQKILIQNRLLNKWLRLLIAIFIIITTIYISNNIINQLKKEEEKKVQTIVIALQIQSSVEGGSSQSSTLALKVLEDNTTIPLILVDENNVFSYQKNLDEIAPRLENDPVFLKNYLKKLEEYHAPIKVILPFGVQKIYYENSSLLTKLRYYPIILIFVIILFILFVFWYFKLINISHRSLLWAGMAKETAHQIGTPLSSLLGWLEILKMENVDKDIINEMTNDVQRLNQIALRFSKIGSIPKLQKTNIVEVVEQTYHYLKKRISSKINFTFHSENNKIMAMISPELLSWVLENLVKNAVDAMQNKGELQLNILEQNHKIIIQVRDNGAGIPPKKIKQIFEPGYTTKKRGWGLGLSLAKRIITEYHKGKIYVDFSDKKRGTQFCIELNKI